MVSAVNTSVEYKLITELLTGYDVNARPVARQNDTVTVKIGMALREIVGLVRITKKQFLSQALFNFFSFKPFFLISIVQRRIWHSFREYFSSFFQRQAFF